jgi:dTDP-4-dehydrorhamnose reductase
MFGKSINLQEVVVLGATGMAGHMIIDYLESINKFHVIGIARHIDKRAKHVLDVRDFNALGKMLVEIKPKYVINCIGILNKSSESNISDSILINSYLPHFLSELGNKIDFRLVHLSTDCVFSGKKGQYSEHSFCDGNNYYSKTKALGEVSNDKDVTIRTSIIGPELNKSGIGLLHWFLNQSNEVDGYANVFWSGVTTLELAKVIVEILDQNISGLLHFCPQTKISKYDLLHLISETFAKEIVINPNFQYKNDKSLISTRDDFIYSAPEYRKMLDELYSWMKNRRDSYDHYKLLNF